MEKTVAQIDNFMDPESVKARTNVVIKTTTSQTVIASSTKPEASKVTKVAGKVGAGGKRKKARSKIESFFNRNKGEPAAAAVKGTQM